MQKSYAYIRLINGEEDKIDKIINEMRSMQILEENIYYDCLTKEDRSCPQYHKMLINIKKGDLLYIENFSALGDGYKAVWEQWKIITKEKAVDVIVMDMPEIDTRREKNEHCPVIADIVLSMLEYIAVSENNVRKKRQREGIIEAKERGIMFGRPESTAPDFGKAYNKWANKEISAQKAADMCGLSKTTFYRRAKRVKENLNN